jgi:hypothetical protein
MGPAPPCLSSIFKNIRRYFGQTPHFRDNKYYPSFRKVCIGFYNICIPDVTLIVSDHLTNL